MLQKLRMALPQGIKGEYVVTLPQTFDNAKGFIKLKFYKRVEEVSSTFPKGKKYDENWSFPYLTVSDIDKQKIFYS